MSSHQVVVKRERTLKDEIDQLLHRADERAQNAGSSKAYAREASKKIHDAAAHAQDCAPILHAIKEEIREAQLLITILTNMLVDVEALEAQRERNKLFGDEWWLQQRTTLLAVSEKNSEQGFQAWLQVYVQALLAWELKTCEKLVLEAFPKANESLGEVFRRGTRALIDGRYEESFQMLEHLTRESSDDSSQSTIGTEQIALIDVLKGRIYKKADDQESALKQFELARQLAPKSGPPCAALSDYYLSQRSTDQAVTWAQRAVELAPARADGYVALGLWAENDERLNESREFYTQAVSRVWNEKDPYVALVGLLAPVASNLLLCLAERLLKEGYPQPALTVLDEAFKLVAKEDGVYKDLWGRRLRGEILEALGRLKEASDVYFEAGLERYNVDDSAQAVELFKCANKANPEHQPTYWYLMDALRMTSYNSAGSVPPQAVLDECLDVWKKGLAISLPDEEYSWAYLSRALVNDQRSLLPKVDRLALWWEAAGFLEQAILRDKWDAARWAFLSRFYRYLHLNANALQASDVALNIDSESPSALEEKCALMANIGMFDEAEALVEKRLKQSRKDMWARGVRAYLYLHKEKYEEAVDLLDSIIKDSPKDLWYFDLRALCYRLLNNRKASQDEYRSILETAKEMSGISPTDQGIIGSAAYQLGQLDDAISSFNLQLDDPAEADEAYRSLGLCYLIQSDSLQGREQITKLKASKRSIYQGIQLATDVRELDDFLKFDLSEFEGSSPRWSGDVEQKKALALIKLRLRKRRKNVERQLSPAEELQQVVSQLDSGNRENIWGWIAARAGLARLAAADERWVEAANIYRELKEDTERFPEAQSGLENCIAELSSEGETRLKENKASESVERFQQALALQREISDPDKIAKLQQKLGDALLNNNRTAEALVHFHEVQDLLLQMASSLVLGEGGATVVVRAFKWARQFFGGAENVADRLQQLPISESNDQIKRRRADVAVRLSFTHFQLGDIDTSRKKLSLALQLYSESNTPDPGTVVGTICHSLLNDKDRYWALDAEWAAFMDDPTTDEPLRNNLAKARDALATYLSDFYELSETGQGPQMVPVTTPIGLEVGVSLLPEDPENTSPFFKTYWPEMRKRIQDEMGVQVPGVRVGESDDPAFSNSYLILLDEIPVEEGQVEPAMRYCPMPPAKLQELGIGELDLIEAVHPLTGEPGCWVEEKAWPRIKEHALELWDDPLLYVTYHLEDVLRRNLADFLGTQELKNLLEEWRQTETGQALVDSAVLNQSSELRLGRTLRALLKEQVPITSWEEILKTIQILGLPNDDVSDVVRAARLKLKRQLPGNTPAARRIELPGEIESAFGKWLRQENGKTFIAIPPAPLEEFFSEIHKLVDGNQDKALLVVESVKLRPFMHRVIEVGFPKLKVLAREELISSSEFHETATEETRINGVSADA